MFAFCFVSEHVKSKFDSSSESFESEEEELEDDEEEEGGDVDEEARGSPESNTADVSDESQQNDVTEPTEDDSAREGDDAANADDESPAPDSPEDPAMKLPPYYPAIQGCRNVEEFTCLNRIEEGTYGVVYRALDKKTSAFHGMTSFKWLLYCIN